MAPPLASPVPDRRVIPLDMFPTDLLESVVTSKGYTALPTSQATTQGGTLELRTRSYPLEREFKVNISSGYNSATTLQDGLRYAGGGLDFLGFDDGTRALPSLIPTDRQVRFGSNFTRADLAGIGQAFQGDWGPTAQTARPPLSASVSLGDESEVFGRRLGYVASVNWSDSPSTRSDYVERQFVGSNLESFVAEFDYEGQLSTRNVALGGLLNGSMELAAGHELRANLLYSHLGEDQAREFRGFNLDSNTDQLNTRIQFIEQSMFNGQLEGTHLLPWAGESLLDWRAGYTLANRYEPNTREVLYRLAPDGRFLFDNFIQSGSVFHQDLEDAGASGAIDLEVPFTVSGLPSAFKMGGSLQVKDRDVLHAAFPLPPGAGRPHQQRHPCPLPEPASGAGPYRDGRIRDRRIDVPRGQLRRCGRPGRGVRHAGYEPGREAPGVSGCAVREDEAERGSVRPRADGPGPRSKAPISRATTSCPH